MTGQRIRIVPGAKRCANPPKNAPTISQHYCGQVRLNLAQINNERRCLLIPDEANRGNVSFYTVDPRGLPAWDASLGPRDYQPPPDVDQANLKNRIDSLQTLAEATDGLAIVNSTDLDRGMRRIVDDLTGYSLPGVLLTEKTRRRFHDHRARQASGERCARGAWPGADAGRRQHREDDGRVCGGRGNSRRRRKRTRSTRRSRRSSDPPRARCACR